MKTMRLKVMFVLVFMAIFCMLLFARGESWTNYPVATYPSLVADDWTLLVGSKSHHTNNQVPMSVFLQLTKTNAQAGMQPQSSNLDSWSDIDPATKQDHSANLDLWNAVTPSSYQLSLGYTPATTNFATALLPGLILPDGVTLVIDPVTHKLSSVATGTGDFVGPNSATSGNIVTFGSGTGKLGADSGHKLSEYAQTNILATTTLNGILSAVDWTTFNGKQAHSANLDLWSSFTPASYTNGLYSLFQPLLGFTPLTFNQTSNLILTLTVPLDMLSTNGQVSIFGIDSNTNPVPIHLRNNLSFTANGVGGYDLNASGSGGGGTVRLSSNYLLQVTNEFVWNLAAVQHLTLRLNTNLHRLTLTNIYALTNYDAQLDTWEDTNGTWAILSTNVPGGLLRRFGGWRTTNASSYDTAIIRLDGTGTNVLARWDTNAQPGTSFTNTLTAGGGGGGGGTAFTVVSTANQAGTSGTTTTAAISTTGANGIAICVSGAGTPTDSSGNTWTLESSGAACNWFFCASPTVSGSHTFSIASAQNIIVVAFTKAGGTPSFDQETHAGTTGNWGAVSMQPGAITPGAADSILLTGAWWDVNITSSTIAVNSSFNLVGTGLWNGSGGTHAAYKILSSASSQNPTWSESFGSNPDGKCGMISIK